MEITFTCPKCGEVTLIGEEFVGQSGECRACGAMVTVPAIRAESTMASSATEPLITRSHGWLNWFLYGVIGVLCLIVVSMCIFPNTGGREAARNMSSKNNLKQIGLAMHNYHDTSKQFPKAYYLTAEGERRLSWRVAILPFMESSDVFDRYRAEEPWDSELNRNVAELHFYGYRSPGEKTGNVNDTSYMVITGPGTMFEEGKDISFADCTDGTANTILAVEVANSGVNWTQPVDLDIRNMIFKINGGGFGISSPWKGGANVAFADGHVAFLSEKTLEATLKAMITRAGGETIADVEGS